MSSVGRTVKNLEAPRPLKSTLKQSYVQPMFEVQSIEELITLTENVAATLQSGCNDAEGMNALLSNLRIHGPQLEMISKDTLDRTFVIFRNASQDERLNIMTRLNLLELIELRAKAWQITEGLNTYYKHKATNVEPEVSMNEQQQQQLQLQTQQSLLGTSPPAMSLGQSPTVPILAPGELLRNSGKFPKPTKIPGKNYSKDEVVIRNADSGKVMGIKGRRVHMIEELSETIISFQRVTPGAKERLVQITGPNEEKINYAKQLIEDTIRRNTSPIRLDSANQEDCCSLASSSASDDTAARVQHTSNNRNSIGASILPSSVAAGTAAGLAMAQAQFMSNHQMPSNMGGGGGGVMQMMNAGKMARNGGPMGGGQPPNLLLHSFSTNDASLGEYKYTVNVGQHNIKITGECFDLVRVAKLVLDDYFSSNEFLASVDLTGYEQMVNTVQPQLTPLAIHQPHHLITGSPFVDSGINLDMMAQTPPLGGGGGGKPYYGTQKSVPTTQLDQDDDVFIVEEKTTLKPHNSSPSMESSSSSSSTVNAAASAASNGLSRSRRSHFSRKDTAIEAQPTKIITDARVSYEYERLILFSKSPHSWALPQEWLKICDRLPQLVKNKEANDEKNRFDADKYLEQKRMKLSAAASQEPTAKEQHSTVTSTTPE